MQYNSYEMKSDFSVMDPLSLIACNDNSNQRKRRGRPCARERRTNELITEKYTNLMRSGEAQDEEFTKNRVIPFIIKRQRRSRANDRERGRMENLNSAMIVLKQHIPLELFQSKLSGSEDETSSSCSNSGRKWRRKSDSKTYTKITKIDTLRFASEYILLLTNMLKESDAQRTSSSSRLYGSIYDSNQSSSSNNSSPVYSQQGNHQEIQCVENQSPMAHKFAATNVAHQATSYGCGGYKFNNVNNHSQDQVYQSNVNNAYSNYDQFTFTNSYQNQVGFYNCRNVNMYNY